MLHFFKGCLIFYIGRTKLNANVGEAVRTPCSVLQVVLNINEGLYIKRSDGQFYTFGQGVEPETV